MPEKYGELLGSVQIKNTLIEVYSNGDCSHVSGEFALDDEGNYLGIKYQCVSFVRRFIYREFDINMASLWQNGDAKDWYNSRAEMNLEEITPQQAQEGDIITFTGGNWGHVGIISKKNAQNIFITQQNFLNDKNDIHYCIKNDILLKDKAINDANGNPYYFQSILRVKA